MGAEFIWEDEKVLKVIMMVIVQCCKLLMLLNYTLKNS